MADCRENNGVKKNSKRFGSSRKHGQEMTSVMAQSSTKERPPLSTRYLSAPELSPNFSYCPTWFSSSDKSSGLTGTSLSSKISRRDPWIPQGTSTPEGSMSPDSVSSSSFQSISSDTLPSSECEEEETSPYQKYSTPEINRALNLASEKQDETTNEMLQQLQTPFKRKKADFRNKEDVNPLGSGIKYGQEMVPGFACTSTETLSPATSKASLNFSHHPSWFQPSMESSSSNLKPGSPCPSLIISTDASSSYECDDDDEDGSFLYTEFFKQEPNQEPSRQPNREPNQEPGREPNRKPNREHKQEPGREPNQEPSCEPNQNPRQEPNRELNQEPNQKPCRELNQELNRGPNHKPNREPNQKAKEKPNQEPGQKPKQEPFKEPNQKPSHEPNQKPRRELNREPKQNTSQEHNREPNQKPGQRPNQEPNQKPGRGPNQEPTQEFNREPNLKFVHQKGETTKDEIPHQFQALVKEEMTRDTCNFLFEGTLTRSSFPSLSVSTGIEHNRDRGSPSVESSAFDLKREPNFASFHQPNETTNADILQQLQDTTTCARDVSPSSLPSSSLASSDASTDTSSGSEYDEDESSSDLASVHQQDEMAKEKILQKLQECIPFQTKIAKIKEREDVERHLYPLGSNVNHEQKETRSTKEHQPPLAMHPSTQDVSISLPHGSAWLPPSTKCSGQTRTSLSNEICSTDPLPSEAAGVNKICISRSPMPSSPCSSLSISTDTSSSSEYDDDGTSLSDESSATETNQERNLAFVDETTKDEILQRLQERWREMNQRVEDIRNKKST